ncbi:MAG: PspC domain [Candidatus Parcubacteria bacterium]|jgi:phage shock protein C
MKTLRRNSKDAVIAGVFAGIGKYLGIDPVLVRLCMLTLLVLTGFAPIGVLYIGAIFLMPVEHISDDTEQV